LSFWETLTSSLKSVFSNKLRTLLTTLGIIIGIASVITITSIGSGMSKSMEESFSKLGVGKITVSMANSRTALNSAKLTLDDLEVLKQSPNITYISPTYSGRGSVTIKLLDPTETKNATVTGVGSDQYYIDEPTLLYGRYIAEADVTTKSKVVVINDTTAEKVFGYKNAVGEKISLKTSLGTKKYTVIGIIENANAETETTYSSEYPETLVMPVTTLMSLYGQKYLSNFAVIVSDPDNADAIGEELVSLLEKAHDNEGDDAYYVQNMMSMMETVNETLTLVTTFIAFVAGISLLVGGIGVMNIMMVTVTERTREIGIRKSIGARNSDIRTQFLIEAILLTGLGGILGIGFGYIGGIVVGKFADVTPYMSPAAVLIAFGISTLIGIIFGVSPANKAAKLDPIEALRYE
jgi:putative ABC transport system permease protein